MKKMMISKNNQMKSIVVIMLLVMFLIVGGCTDSPAKIDSNEPGIDESDTQEAGIITMVTFAEVIDFTTFGKGEMFVSIEWENVPPDSVVTEWVFLLSEYDNVNPHTTFTIPVPFSDGIITVKGHITHFECNNNELIDIDVTGMPSLLYLRCVNNFLSILDLSKNILLENLNCHNNLLSNIDVSNNLNLRYLTLDFNLLTSLDISNNIFLTYLRCDYNQLTNLDVTNNHLLKSLGCSLNQLNVLDLSKNVFLADLNVGWNQLEYLDLRFNNKLRTLNIDQNKIKRIDLNNNSLSLLFAQNIQFDTEALNELFHTLPEISYYNYYYDFDIDIRGNPGEDDCDKSIAEAKGWRFRPIDTRNSEQDIDKLKEKYINNIRRKQ